MEQSQPPRSSGLDFISNSANWPVLLGGVLQVGIGVISGVVGVVVVVILTLYFMASLEGMKDYLAKLSSASKRERFRKITDQIAYSVGRWVMGQTSVSLIHATSLFIFPDDHQCPVRFAFDTSGFHDLPNPTNWAALLGDYRHYGDPD